MSPKFLLFITLVALTTIEGHHFLKNLKKRDLNFSFASQKTLESIVRKRRDAVEDSSSETSDEAGLTKFFVGVGWRTHKKEFLGGFLEELSDSDNNLTVIGWQRILDNEGKIKEIRTIQLVIPPKPEQKPSNIVEDEEEEDDDGRALPHAEIEEMRKVLEPLALIGIPASVTGEEFDEDGKEELLTYLDKDELYAHSAGFSIYNKTSIASSQDVSSFIASLKPKALGKPSVLKYDVDGNLLVEQSHIRPHLLGLVNDHYEASDKLLVEAPQIIAQISQQYPKSEVPKQLAVHYNKAYPEYKWRVLVDPQNYYITRDVELDLTYDTFDFDVNSAIRYVVYGSKKSTPTQ